MRGLAARGSEAPSCDELEMTVRAIWDGEQPINHQFHTFVPSDWLARAAPDQAELCARVEQYVRNCFADPQRRVTALGRRLDRR
jgi:hypothetical protein